MNGHQAYCNKQHGRRKGGKGAFVLALMCALLLVICAVPLASCSPANSKDSVHLLIKVPRTGHDVVFDESITYVDQVITKLAESFAESYDKADVDIEVEVFEQNEYDEAIVNRFDTDKAADILYGDYFNMSTYIHTGRVVPLDDAISESVRDDIFNYLWDLSTVEGKVYMMPYLARQNVLAYNKELMAKAGLESYIDDTRIQSWTLEEWTEILDALAASLSDSEYPMMMYAGSSQGDTHIMTLLRSAGGSFFDETGHFDISSPEGVAALRWIQDGVERNWYPPHCENLEIEDCSGLFRQGQLAIYMINNASIARYGDTIGLVNFPSSDEDGCATTFVSGFEVFDNGDPEKVQVAKDFISYIYESKDLLSYAAGTLPASRAVSDMYGSEIPSFQLFLDNQDNVVDFTGNNPDTRAVRDVFYTYMHDLLMGNLTPEQAAALIDESCNNAIDEGVAASILHE